MTQEDKELLLKDLCARLPYGVICFAPDYEYGDIGKLWCVEPFEDLDPPITIQYPKGNIITKFCSEIKPYLRPMSSMTEEEKKIIRSYGFELIFYDTCYTGFANTENCIDEVSFRFMEEFLNAHHLDYRGLIPKGLAIEVTKENNPYKE